MARKVKRQTTKEVKLRNLQRSVSGIMKRKSQSEDTFKEMSENVSGEKRR